MKATIAFAVFFLMIAPKSRAILAGWMGDASKWVVAWAPLSYLVVAIAIAAPVAAAVLMVKWPKPVEPENPMAKYKHDDVID